MQAIKYNPQLPKAYERRATAKKGLGEAGDASRLCEFPVILGHDVQD